MLLQSNVKVGLQFRVLEQTFSIVKNSVDRFIVSVMQLGECSFNF